jgi:carbon starvation protein
MSTTAILLTCLAAFALAYATYGVALRRLFGLDAGRRTPAHELQDGEDHVPTPRAYLLGQHFSAITAAGPIVGPIVATLAFGWLPALLWIVLGAIFIGAAHDLSALVGSVRHGARSLPDIVRVNVSRPAYYLFLAFVWLALVYVIVAFTDITARSFVFDVGLPDGRTVAAGGVATSSLLYLLVGLAMGLAMRYLKPRLWAATLVFVPLVGAAIWVGQRLPLSLAWLAGPGPDTQVRGWSYVLLLYCGVASVIPVWVLLQSRGYLGGFFLYGVLGAALVGIVVGGGDALFPAFRGFTSETLGPLFPVLFVTIACGACSGFHGMVCSGTTSKQLDREPDAHAVGYGGMLLEGVVAVISVICVAQLLPEAAASGQAPDKIYALGIGRFVQRFGVDPQVAVAFASLAFATFVYDTLDVATRLGRYVLQELSGRRSRGAALVATLLTFGVPALFVSATLTDAKGVPVPAWRVFWSIFGTSNQLLAALTLLGLTVWLRRSGRVALSWLLAVPMAFMMTMTCWSLVLMLRRAWERLQSGLGLDAPGVVAFVLLALAALLLVEAARALRPGAAPSVPAAS